MSGAWDPFMPQGAQSLLATARAEAAALEARQQQRDATRAVFATPTGRTWLRERLARELAAPSYVPGMPFDQVAFAEGRKAMLREIEAEAAAPPPAADQGS